MALASSARDRPHDYWCRLCYDEPVGGIDLSEQAASAAPPATVRCRAQVLANIVDCGNTAEKFRRLRISNGKFHDGVWCKPGGSQASSPSVYHPRSAPVTSRLKATHCPPRALVQEEDVIWTPVGMLTRRASKCGCRCCIGNARGRVQSRRRCAGAASGC